MHPWYKQWPCVCPSITSWCSTKTAKHRITQTAPHDSPGNLVFWSQRFPRNSTGVDIPYGGAKCRWGWSKSATFDKWTAISRKQYKIDTWFLLKSNRKLYALYRMVTLPMTLSPPNHPKPPHFLHFAPPFIASTGEPRDFKFGALTYHSKSHPTDEKSSLKGTCSGSGDPF